MSYLSRTAVFIAVVVIVFGAMVALQRVLGSDQLFPVIRSNFDEADGR
jgi:hypothetical protein